MLSDRRYHKIGHTWKISAAIHGRSAVNVWDTVLTPHMLWDFPEDLAELKAILHLIPGHAKTRNGTRTPADSFNLTVKKWLEKEDELHAFQFKKEIGGALNKDAAERLKATLEDCRMELEETAEACEQTCLLAGERKETAGMDCFSIYLSAAP